MSAPTSVALLGFSSAERTSLATFFKLAPQRSPAYTHVLDIDEARFVVADADQPGVPELLETLGRTGDSIFVGSHGPASGAAWMMRPIDPAQVLRKLDQLLSVRDNPSSAPLPLHTRPGALARAAVAAGASLLERVLPSRRVDESKDKTPTIVAASMAPQALDRPAAPRADRPLEPQTERQIKPQADQAVDQATDPTTDKTSRPSTDQAAAPQVDRKADARDRRERRERREAALRPVTVRRALLVDDSEVALAYLERQLHRHDIAADWAMNSSKAIELMSQRAYGMVFLDIDLGDASDLDGLALCQHIKRRHVHPSGRAPLVVLVSAFSDPVDRVRGSLAGADAHLGKPLDSDTLDRLLTANGLGRETGAGDLSSH